MCKLKFDNVRDGMDKGRYSQKVVQSLAAQDETGKEYCYELKLEGDGVQFKVYMRFGSSDGFDLDDGFNFVAMAKMIMKKAQTDQFQQSADSNSNNFDLFGHLHKLITHLRSGCDRVESIREVCCKAQEVIEQTTKDRKWLEEDLYDKFLHILNQKKDYIRRLKSENSRLRAKIQHPGNAGGIEPEQPLSDICTSSGDDTHEEEIDSDAFNLENDAHANRTATTAGQTAARNTKVVQRSSSSSHSTVSILGDEPPYLPNVEMPVRKRARQKRPILKSSAAPTRPLTEAQSFEMKTVLDTVSSEVQSVLSGPSRQKRHQAKRIRQFMFLTRSRLLFLHFTTRKQFLYYLMHRSTEKRYIFSEPGQQFRASLTGMVVEWNHLILIR